MSSPRRDATAHRGVFGVGAVNGGRILPQILLGAPLGVVGLAGPFGPAVAVGVEGDALDTQAHASLLEFRGPIAGAHFAQRREQWPLGGPPLEHLSDFLSVLDHRGFEVGVLLHPLEHFLAVVADEVVILIDILVGHRAWI